MSSFAKRKFTFHIFLDIEVCIWARKGDKIPQRNSKEGRGLRPCLQRWGIVKSLDKSILVLLLLGINVEMKVSEMWCLESEWSNKKSFLFAKLFMLFPFTFSQLGLYETLWSWLTQIQKENLYFSSRQRQMVKVFWAKNLVDIYMKIRIRKMNAASRDGILDFYNRMEWVKQRKVGRMSNHSINHGAIPKLMLKEAICNCDLWCCANSNSPPPPCVCLKAQK